MPGFVKDHTVQDGSGGSPIQVDSTTYYLSKVASGVPIAHVAATTVYASSGAETTTYAYTFFEDTNQPASQTTTLPSITADEASGSGDASTEEFDQAGRVIWTKDASGYINYFAYDPATSAMTMSVIDISAAKITTLSLTCPWTPLSVAHQNLTTQWQVDNLGRTTKLTDPNGNITYTVYLDPEHETRVYPGFYTTSSGTVGHTTGPIQVTRDDVDNNYSETFTMAVAPQLTSGVPDGGETIGNIQSLSRSLMNDAGQVTETDDYFDLTTNYATSPTSTWAYSTTAQIGLQWASTASPTTAANYYATTYAYGPFGDINRTVNPDGTIRRAVYDGLDRLTSIWFGTHDTPTTGAWSPTNLTGTDMAELSAAVYDNGFVGDSNVTETVAFPAGTTGDASKLRVEVDLYDWRDRLIASKSGALVSGSATGGASFFVDGMSSPLYFDTDGETTDGTSRAITYYVLDNLGEATAIDVYAGDGVSPSDLDAGGAPSSSYDSDLRSETTQTFDEQGRVYSTSVYNVVQSGGDAGDTTGSPETTSAFFTARGLVDHTTDAMGGVTTYSWDGGDRLISQRNPDPSDGSLSSYGPLTQFAYDADSNLISETDPLGNVTAWTFDAANRETSMTAPNPGTGSATDGLTTTYAYDADSGRLQYVTDPVGDVTEYADDALGRRTAIYLPNPVSGAASGTRPTTVLTYDGDNNVRSVIDPVGNKTDYTFTPLDQLATQSETVATSYTREGTDHHVVYSYATDETKYYYDNLGNMTETVDADGRAIVYAYNVLNQRTSETWFDNTTDAAAGTNVRNTINYTYNVADILNGATDTYQSSEATKDSAYAFGVDSFGNITGVDNLGGLTGGTAGAPDVVLNAQFDANNNRKALDAVIAGTADFQDTFQCDYLNRQTQVIQQGASGGNPVAYKKLTLAYDADSELNTISDYLNSTTPAMTGTFTRDDGGRVTEIDWQPNFDGYGGELGGADGTGVWEEFYYSYDNDSRVTSISSYAYGSEGQALTYDHDRQLTQADLGDLAAYGGAFTDNSFTWDLNGNPTGSGTTVFDSYGGYWSTTDNAYVIGAGNRLLSDGTYDYTYDYSGHMLTRIEIATGNETDYSWDNRGRMTSVKDYVESGSTLVQTQQVDYWYDMFDRLIGRKLTPYSGGTPETASTSRFVYDGQNMVLAFSGSSTLTNRYLWGPAVDQILAQELVTSTSAAGETLWATTDDQGSVHDWIYAWTGVAEHLTYDSFGAVTSGGATSGIEFAHDGTLRDAATGLEYHSDPSSGSPGRWYDPAAKRWLSPDPAGLAPDSNPYRYVDNSPTNFVDPSGTIETSPSRSVFIIGGGSNAQDTKAGLPRFGTPNSSDHIEGPNGQIRDYGPDGGAKTDYDFGHAHHHPDLDSPHAHDWVPGPDGPERDPKARNVRPNEVPPAAKAVALGASGAATGIGIIWIIENFWWVPLAF